MISRRKFIKTSIASTGALLTGCCNFRRPPDIDVFSPRALGAEDFLSTNRLFRTRISYQAAIDAHTHFFNATDLQAGGYFAGPIASEWGLNGALLREAGAVIDALARKIAPSAYDEFKYLDRLENTFKGRSGRDIQSELESHIKEQNKVISEELFKELNKTDFPSVFSRTTQKIRSINADLSYSEELILEILNDPAMPDKATTSMRSSDGKQSRAALSIFTFLGLMLSYRTHNIHRYRKSYFENGANIKVVKAANAMVDFDRWVGKCDEAYSSTSNQIKLYDRLAQVHGNYIFNLVSFNPWSALKYGEPYWELITSALRLDSFKGVKIYPPIGYYPLGNAQADQPVWPKGHPDPQKIDNELQRLYTECASLNAVVMAHGNHSMGAIPEFKQLAGPSQWKTVLDRNSGLKVNIGHFGGDSKVDGIEWTLEFLKMMTKNSGVRGDIGYWDRLYEASNIDRFKEFLKFPISQTEDGSHRILYGSDWFMNSKDKGWQDYAETIYKNLVSAGVTQKQLNRLFYENSLTFFNLDV